MNHRDPIDIKGHVWQIMLDEGAIHDGGFSHYQVNDVVRIPMSFFGDLSLTTEHVKSIAPLNAAGFGRYFVVAEIVEIRGEAWVIDFGFRSAADRFMPDGATVGAFVTGEIVLAPDVARFRYIKTLSNPELVSLRWLIKGITKRHTPLRLDVGPSGSKTLRIDVDKHVVYEDVLGLSHDITATSEEFSAFFRTVTDGGDSSAFSPMGIDYLLSYQLVDDLAVNISDLPSS